MVPLGLHEIHIYDHEIPPECDYRHRAAEAVNKRECCQAFVTTKRSLESYLHPDAIRKAMEIDVAFGDFDPVVELTAKRIQERDAPERPWELLPRRTQAQRTHRAKRRLNTIAVDLMSVDMLRQSDPDSEVISWLASINELLKQA